MRERGMPRPPGSQPRRRLNRAGPGENGRVLRSSVFLGGQAVSLLGDGLALLAVPLLVLRVTGSPAVTVLASLPGSAGYLVAGLPAGIVADRLSPWLILMSGDALRAALFAVLFALTGSRAVSPWLILSLAFAAGIVTVFCTTALDIAVRDVFAGPRLVSANSWLESASQGGQIIGPGVAGLLAAAGLLHESLLIDAVTFLVSLATLAAVRGAYREPARPPRPAVSWPGVARELAEGLRYLAATRLLRTLLVFILVLNLCLGADKLIVYFARSTLHLPAGQVGLVVTAGGVGGLAGAAGTSLMCRRLGPLPVIALCSAVSGIALVVIAAATSARVLLAGNLLYLWAITAASVALRSVRQAVVRRDLLGRVTASWRLGGQAVTLIGAVVAGAMASLLGDDPRPVFGAAGLLSLLTVAVAWLAGLRRESAAPAPGGPAAPIPGAAGSPAGRPPATGPPSGGPPAAGPPSAGPPAAGPSPPWQGLDQGCGEQGQRGQDPQAQGEGVREGAAVQRAVEDHADHGHPERSADLLEGRQHAGGRARVLRLDVAQHRRRQRDQHHADAEPGHGQAGQQLGRGRARRAGPQQQAAGRGDQRAQGQDLPAEPDRHRLSGQHRGEEAHADGREDLAREQRREPAALLQVQGQDEEERRRHEGEGQPGERAEAEGPVAEQAGIDQRGAAGRAPPQLVHAEPAEQEGRGGQAQPRPQRPAVLLPLDQRQDDRGQPQRGQQGASQVEPGPLTV
jgi:MFS family permease